MAADNARFFMDDGEADRLMLDGERAIVRAGLDHLAEQDPELVMERVGNGVIGKLVDLEILRPEDAADIQAKAEGEMARQAAQAAAAAGVERALGVAAACGPGCTPAPLDRYQLAAPSADAYPRPMCRNITRNQQIEGWRAFLELLPKLRPGALAVLWASSLARLRRGNYAR